MRQLFDSLGCPTVLKEGDVIKCKEALGCFIKISLFRKQQLLLPSESIQSIHLYSFLNGLTIASGLSLKQTGTFSKHSSITFTLSKRTVSNFYKNIFTKDGCLTYLEVNDYIYCDQTTNTLFFKRKGDVLHTKNNALQDTVCLDLPSVLHAIELATGLTVPRRTKNMLSESLFTGKNLNDNTIGLPLVSTTN